MYCPEMGESRTAWVDIEACCHPDEQSERSELSARCCDYSVVQADLSTLEASASVRLSVPMLDGDAWAGLQLVPGTLASFAPSEVRFERPPPRAGAVRSALLGVMRV